MTRKKIVILGSTGSIGRQTLEVVRRNPGRFEIVGLGAGRNAGVLAEQAREFSPKAVALAESEGVEELARALAGLPIRVSGGAGALEELAALPEGDLVVSALVGTAGLLPTLAAIRAGKDIALANKETLVAAGPVVMREVRQRGVGLLPVDSEHSAIFQCLGGRLRAAGLSRIILTASGGPFRGWDAVRLAGVTPAEALKHPNWAMGGKITVDSATLMNKGLEVIEASWLFGLPPEAIDVLIHPQSIVHSLVEYRDGSVLAQLGWPDMKLPIQYALTWPERLAGPLPALDLVRAGALTFEPPDRRNFPCLDLAYGAAATGGTLPAAMNAANEVAVQAFLDRRLAFTSIPAVIDAVMGRHETIVDPALADILEADSWARREAARLIEDHA